MATNAELSFSIRYFKQQNTTGLNVGKKKDFFLLPTIFRLVKRYSKTKFYLHWAYLFSNFNMTGIPATSTGLPSYGLYYIPSQTNLRDK